MEGRVGHDLSTEYCELTCGSGKAFMRIVDDGKMSAVNLNCATNSPSRSYSTGYESRRSCLTSSTMPSRRFFSARALRG